MYEKGHIILNKTRKKIGAKQPLGKTQERYIYFDKYKNRYVFLMSTGKKRPKQKTIGRFKTLLQAVQCRDKYLSEFE